MCDNEYYLKPFGKSRKCLLINTFSEIEPKIKSATVKTDDVWLVSYPRTGSTWCQEMIWLIVNDLDFLQAEGTLQQLRAPLIEFPVVFFEQVSGKKVKFVNMDLQKSTGATEIGEKLSLLFKDPVKYVDNLPSPRCIKSHLYCDLLPEEIFKVKPKMIYTIRNPKDLCVSYYFHYKMLHKLNEDFETFCDSFMNGSTVIGGVFDHYFSFWNRRQELDILILKYEEMRKDTAKTIRKMADFLGKPLKNSDIDKIVEFLSFQKMRKNKSCNLQMFMDSKEGEEFYEKSGTHFIRKGVVGDHKNYMSESMITRFDRWIDENTRGTGLQF
ncbi:hypothetical protein ABEB36_011979 [Hypothenemus hampei]|uniref:Sulfotransferase domain-containing protein n=1 Tax=Hypothenemus hampei TaxID=57062 RepID=A0ABD1EBP6_HYPHA